MPATDADRDHRATLSFEYSDETCASVVADALAPEVGDLDESRSRATVSRDGDIVHVRVAATDLVALRAGMVSWSRLVAVAEGVSRDRYVDR
ncbi:KEOPS complex Pcc1-like subunit [Halorubrum sp. 48-1-W]|uniref:KEOPS complex subunit Pcc1 n=1 Tax=Halorubrum sp. 48-1-W TaxID=2249761 RepID=UPI000DCD7CC3|nr:KEOPS complex subunit Pcc1 [Halorubrum sp. 48-1-W]RAW46632.1 KEOPS complex Pcc1-like subunit [Halorubrum sp. 48-1-W]